MSTSGYGTGTPVDSPEPEDDLKDFMVSCLAATATALGLTSSSFDEAVVDTLYDYGVEDIADASDTKKLRALARVHAWRTALAQVSADYNYSDGGATYNRKQMHEMIVVSLRAAENIALPYNSDYVMDVDRVDDVHDPYEYHESGSYVEIR